MYADDAPIPTAPDSPPPGAGWRQALRSRGAWALVDQGVVSLGNCLSGIVLVAALPLTEFGAFTLLFGVLLFLNSLHQSLVTYPLSVRGASDGASALRRLAGGSVHFTALLAVPLAVGVAATAVLLGRAPLVPWLLAALLLWQVQETLRRALMAQLRHRDALLGDAVRYLGQVLVLWLLTRRQSPLTLDLAFGAIAATSLLAAIVQAIQLRPSFSLRHCDGPLLRDAWGLGRWVLLTNAVTIVTVQAMPWTLGAFHGNAEVARFGAMALVMGITNPVVLGIGALVIPFAARAAAHDGPRAARGVAGYCGLLGALVLAPFYAAVLLVPEFVIGVFTRGNADYAGLSTHLRLFALAYLLAFPAQVIGALLNGLGRSRQSFGAQFVFAGATLLVSLPLAASYGLAGAVWGGLAPAAAFAAVSFAMARRVGRDEPQRSEPNPRPGRDLEAAPIAGVLAKAGAEGVAA